MYSGAIKSRVSSVRLSGVKNVRIFSFDPDYIQTHHKNLRPFVGGKFSHHNDTRAFSFDFLDLCGALARTAILRANVPESDYLVEGYTTALRLWRHFEDGPELRFREDRRDFYKDFERVYFSARLGEALGYLATVKVLGMYSINHFEAVRPLLGLGGHKGLENDYVVSTANGLELVEFKGTTAYQSSLPNFRAGLRAGLKQTRSIARHASCPVAGQHALVSVLHGENKGDEPSFIAHVQIRNPEVPINREIQRQILINDAIASLALAGFEGPGERRRAPDTQRRHREDRKIQVGTYRGSKLTNIGWADAEFGLPDLPFCAVDEEVVSWVRHATDFKDIAESAPLPTVGQGELAPGLILADRGERQSIENFDRFQLREYLS